jgi:PIN domain
MWPFVKKILVDERIALHAVQLCREHGLQPADAVHVASAMAVRCDALQCWDKDFSKVSHLVMVEAPAHISPQGALALSSVGPTLEESSELFPDPPIDGEMTLSPPVAPPKAGENTGEGTRTPTEPKAPTAS